MIDRDWTNLKGTDRVAAMIAFGLGSGLSPKAPGTVGSVPGLLLGYVIHRMGVLASDVTLFPFGYLVVVLLLGASVYGALVAIARTEEALGIHDDQRIVVDEVVGQAIAIAFVSPTIVTYVAGFVLFRLLDISKPALIGKIDREVKGAWGTLGDDVLAGAVAAPFVIALSRYLAS